jgi:hypothetical protein
LADVPEDGDAPTTNTTKLLEKIRRQLMQDNYDYLPSEEETMPTVQYDAHDQRDSDPTTTAPLANPSTRYDFSLRANDFRQHNVSTKDLLYYIDDEHIRRNMDDNQLGSADTGDTDYLQDTTPKPKYKLITVSHFLSCFVSRLVWCSE